MAHILNSGRQKFIGVCPSSVFFFWKKVSFASLHDLRTLGPEKVTGIVIDQKNRYIYDHVMIQEMFYNTHALTTCIIYHSLYICSNMDHVCDTM